MKRSFVLTIVLLSFLTVRTPPEAGALGDQTAICRHPDNGVESTQTTALFVACIPKGQRNCDQLAHELKVPASIHVIKGFLDPFLRPWNSSGNPNRCDPQGNSDTPCWAAAEMAVYRRAANPKCAFDSE